MLLGGRITSDELEYSQELQDGCSLVGLTDLKPVERAAFIISSADYCNRDDEVVKYNQEFMLALSTSVGKNVIFFFHFKIIIIFFSFIFTSNVT